MDGQPSTSIARPPTTAEIVTDRAFRTLTHLFALLVVGTVVWIVFEIGSEAAPAVRSYGVEFLTSTTWNPVKKEFGILPEIFGTLYTAVIALTIGTVFGVSVAILLSQHFLPPTLELILKNIIELLAAIPSVVYGLWGIFVVIPTIRPLCNWIHDGMGWVPFFDTPMAGPGVLPAAIVLAIMILPTISAISRDALVAVPGKLREAAYGLGATRWEAILGVILPTARTGIYGSVILAFGRALGETMALAMLVGNANVIESSIFSPANTLAALLANHFPEAGPIEVGALMYAALVLMAITLAVNTVGALIVGRADQEGKR